MATLSSACYVRQQPGQPFKTLNVTNTILRTDKAPSSYRPQCTAKRKSAVELLQETKSLYVKSETVLDRKQELRRSLRSSGSSDKGSLSHDVASGCYHYKGNNCCNWSSGSFTCLPPPKSPRLVAGCQRKSTADSQQLQNDLRRLLNADSKENLFEATSVFLDDDIVPPPVQYRRSASHGQQQHQSCGCGPSAVCHKSLPDLTDVTTSAPETTDTTVTDDTSAAVRRCRRSASSGSVAGDDCEDDDGDDDIFETYCGIVPSPHGFGNKSRPDETDASTNVTSFPDSLSLTSYKTDARWQQSAHGETGSSIEEENDREVGGSVSPRSSASPVKSAVPQGGRRRRPRSAVTMATCDGGGQQTTQPSLPLPALPPPPLPPPPPPPAVAARRQQWPAAVAAADDFRGRPILRSKSDVGHRTPNLLSLLPVVTATAVAADDERHEYDPEQLENFFGHLGLDPEEYKSIIKNDSETGSQVCFGDSNSSVGSVSGGSNGGNVNGIFEGHCAGDRTGAEGCGAVGGAKTGGGGSSSSELPSIVERNARIIKWLWNCRKANLQQQHPPSSST